MADDDDNDEVNPLAETNPLDLEGDSPLTNPDLVASIIPDYDSSIDLEPFIDTAHNLVSRICTDSSYDTATLELIERWMSAHCYFVGNPNPRPISKKTGQAAATFYTGKMFDRGFDSTSYGQMAMALDPAGGLARLNVAIKTGKLRKQIGIWASGPSRRERSFPWWWWNDR